LTQQELATDQDDPLVGQLFEERYQILSVLGQGGMGTVYKARHVHMDKIYAIKTLVQGAVRDDNSFKRFEQEAKAAASLNHPNIISVTDFGRSKQGLAYLVMEFLNGRTLDDIIIESDDFIGLDRFRRIFTQVCAGMQHAHKKGIIHRDLKPSNLMLIDTEDEVDCVKILDFGLAKLSSGDTQHLTQTGVVMGSPPFMSPEQCRGDELDTRADIYALGCVMYATLTGQVPLKGANSMATMYKHISDKPEPISQVSAGTRIPPRLEQVVMQTLEKEPDKRPQTMAELGRNLSEAITDRSTFAGLKALEGKPAAGAALDRTQPLAGGNTGGMAQAGFIPNRPDGGPARLSVPGSVVGAGLGAGANDRAKEAAPVFRASRPAAPERPKTKTFPAAGKMALIVLGIFVAGASALTFVKHSARHRVPVSVAGGPQNSLTSTSTAQSTSTGRASSSSTTSTASTSTDTQSAATSTPTEISKPASKTAAGNTGETGSTAVQAAAASRKAQAEKKMREEEELAARKAEDADKKARDAARKLEALKNADDLNSQAHSAYTRLQIEAARKLYLKCLSEEQIAYGSSDPHLLPTILHILEMSRLENLPCDEHRVTAALEIFSKHEAEAREVVNHMDSPSSHWKILAYACMDLAKRNDGTAKQRYARWAFTFYSYAYQTCSRLKRTEYVKLLHGFLVAAMAAGENDKAEQLRQEINQFERPAPEEPRPLPFKKRPGPFNNWIPGQKLKQFNNDGQPQDLPFARKRRFWQQQQQQQQQQ
jgi:tRNA A-37 threonylcarbamoyl transferase component Bud32